MNKIHLETISNKRNNMDLKTYMAEIVHLLLLFLAQYLFVLGFINP